MTTRILITLTSLLIFASIGAGEPATVSLLERQREIASSFAQIESVMLRMAEAVAVTNPRQSALLKKAYRESRDRLVAMRLDETTTVLQSRRLAETVAAQQQILGDLVALLRLLESDNRAQQREAEQKRNRETLKRLDDIIQRQRSLRAQTDRHDTAAPTAPLAEPQQELRTQTESLAESVSESRGATTPQNATPPNADTPSQPLGRASQAMQAAESQLKGEAREAAIASQNDAVAALQQAKEALEKSLQQLRQEEAIEQLQWLAARLQTMLRLERLVQSDFTALTASAAENSPPDGQPDDERTWRLKCVRLASDQANVVSEANAAILVLREDGRAQAMTESLAQVASDMIVVRDRLTRGQLDAVAQQLINTVIAALEEMVAAAEQSRKEKQSEASTPPSSSGSDAEMGEERRELLSLLAELKMIQTMQRRITERTKLCESMRLDPQTPPENLAAYIDDIARQQATVVRMLENIKAGRHL